MKLFVINLLFLGIFLGNSFAQNKVESLRNQYKTAVEKAVQPLEKIYIEELKKLLPTANEEEQKKIKAEILKLKIKEPASKEKEILAKLTNPPEGKSWLLIRGEDPEDEYASSFVDFKSNGTAITIYNPKANVARSSESLRFEILDGSLFIRETEGDFGDDPFVDFIAVFDLEDLFKNKRKTVLKGKSFVSRTDGPQDEILALVDARN